MKDKTSSFNKLVIHLVLTMFIVSPFIAAVLATLDYNSSRSNTSTSIMLRDLGANETEILHVFDIFDLEIDAYVRYNAATEVAVTVIQREGLSAVEAKRLVGDTGIQKMSAEDVATAVKMTAVLLIKMEKK